LYIKHLFPINKQFSIDSFLDWEGLLLGFKLRDNVSSRFRSHTASIPTPQQRTRYNKQISNDSILALEGHH